MGLGVGIFLIAVGAILAFAVNSTSGAVDVNTVGWILMIVGLLGIVLSMLFWQSWAGPGYWSSPPHDVRRRRSAASAYYGASRHVTPSRVASLPALPALGSSSGFGLPPNIPLIQRREPPLGEACRRPPPRSRTLCLLPIFDRGPQPTSTSRRWQCDNSVRTRSRFRCVRPQHESGDVRSRYGRWSSATKVEPPRPLDSTQMRPPIRSSSSRLM